VAGTEELHPLEAQWSTTRNVELHGVVGTLERRVYRMRYGTDPAVGTQLTRSYREGDTMPDAPTGTTIDQVQYAVDTSDGASGKLLILTGFLPAPWEI